MKRVATDRLGIVGLGRIGSAVARRALAFGMDVAWHDPHVDASGPLPGRRVHDLGELLEASDIVSLHCPLTEETRGLVGREALARIKPGAILVNTARGAIADLDAVHEALRADIAGLDGWKAYLAGPPAMVEACVDVLAELGLPRADCHADAFYTEADKQALQREAAR